MYRDGKRPVPAEKLPTGSIIVQPPEAAPTGVAGYARVSSADQRSDLDGQVAPVVAFVTGEGLSVVRTVTEVGSGLNGRRAQRMEVLADPSVAIVAVERRDRWMRFGAAHVESALAAQGRRLGVVDPGETQDDLVQDRIDVLTRMCAHLYGRRSARNRAEEALKAASEEGRSTRHCATNWSRRRGNAASWPKRRARSGCKWGVHLCKRLRSAGKPVPHAAEMHRRWNAEKPQRSWVYGDAKCCGQEALRDLDRAFANFWRGRKEGRRVGFPRFRRKHGRRDAFRRTGRIQVHPGRYPCRASVAHGPRRRQRSFVAAFALQRSAVRRTVGTYPWRWRWIAMIRGPLVGRWSALTLASSSVRSDGTEMEAPRPLAKIMRRLRHRQRLHSRKQRGSRNRRKSAAGLARLHRRIRCRRADKATTMLAKTEQVVVIEDLSVAGMIRNRSLARSIAAAGWSEFRRMPAYKPTWYGSRLVVAAGFDASSKTCSACGHVQAEMPLGERVFACEACGVVIDRDLNAARNLGSRVAGGSPETQNACGAEGSGRGNSPAKPAAMQQEPSRQKPVAAADGNKRR